MSGFGCPRIPATTWFKEILTIYTAKSSDYAAMQRSHLLGPFSDNLVTLNVCNMRRGFNRPTLTEWGAGDYCLIKVNTDMECDNGRHFLNMCFFGSVLRNSGQRYLYVYTFIYL